MCCRAQEVPEGARRATESLEICGLEIWKKKNGGPTKNRTWNGPLGKGCYIHLTMGPNSPSIAITLPRVQAKYTSLEKTRRDIAVSSPEI